MHDTPRLVLRFALAAVAWTPACGDSTAPAHVVGVYHLVSVNGAPPPATVMIGDVALEFLGGYWELQADRDFAGELVEGATTGAGTVTDTLRYDGTYSVEGDSVIAEGTMVLAVDGRSESFEVRALLSGGDLTSLARVTIAETGDEGWVTFVFRR